MAEIGADDQAQPQGVAPHLRRADRRPHAVTTTASPQSADGCGVVHASARQHPFERKWARLPLNGLPRQEPSATPTWSLLLVPGPNRNPQARKSCPNRQPSRWPTEASVKVEVPNLNLLPQTRRRANGPAGNTPESQVPPRRSLRKLESEGMSTSCHRRCWPAGTSRSMLRPAAT